MQVREFLRDQQVAFDVIEHDPTYDASRMAQAVHVAGEEVAKTVLLRTREEGLDYVNFKYVVAVLPATHAVDFDLAAEALGVAQVELASESEIDAQCPDSESGVLPPFGSQYDMQTIVDESLTEDEEIVFEGNTHQESIRMRYADFDALEQPFIARFAYRR